MFDELTTLQALATLDTVSDFVSYITRKEAFFKNTAAVCAAGEEELLATYLTRTNDAGEHDFIFDAGINAVALDEGHWLQFQKLPKRRAQLEANRISYAWDALIEKFSGHAMAGTQYFAPPGGIIDTEQSLRFLAAENRTRRRMLASSLLHAVETATAGSKFVRVILGLKPSEPYYVMLVMPSTWAKAEDEYRDVRRHLLSAYCLVCKHIYPEALDVVGIACGPACEEYGSEDLTHLDCRNWTAELAAEAARAQTEFKLLLKPVPVHTKYSEYPENA